MPIRYTALVVISATGWIKADLIKGNVRDNDIRTFCLETQEPSPDTPSLGGPPLRTLMKPKSYLIWDRLGREGSVETRQNCPTTLMLSEIYQKRRFRFVCCPQRVIF